MRHFFFNFDRRFAWGACVGFASTSIMVYLGVMLGGADGLYAAFVAGICIAAGLTPWFMFRERKEK